MEEMMRGWAVKAILLTVITSFPFCCVSQINHTVGGPTGWDLSSDIQAWTTTATFHVGDTLVFRYAPVHDVLEVNEVEYTTCHTIKPISVHNSGDTVVPLIEAGTRFFICGRNGHCALGLKFQVDVLPQLDANETHHSPPPHSPETDIPPTPELPGTNPSPGPCGNSAVGGMVTVTDYMWVPLLTTTMLVLVSSLPRLRVSAHGS